jgi:YidC/Oxa1 family membrane protein insertase
MDKKAIIGFILIMVVLLSWGFIWNFIFPPKPQPVTSHLATDTTLVRSAGNLDTTHAKPESLGTALPSALSAPDSAALAAASQEPEKVIAIDTKNIRVVLSSIGGTVRQVVLKHYLNFNGDQVQLLGEQSNPEWARYGALTLGYNDHVAIFNSQSFKTDGDSTILNPQNTSYAVTFTYAAPNGATVTKKYTFHYEDYLFDLTVDIKDPAKLNLTQGVTLGWFSPLEPSEYDITQDRGKLGGFFNMGGEFDYFKKLKGDTLREIVTGPIDWVATRTKYFTTVVIADSEPGREVVVLGGRVAHISPKGGTSPWEMFGVGMTFDNPPADAHYAFNIYTGPLDYDISIR